MEGSRLKQGSVPTIGLGLLRDTQRQFMNAQGLPTPSDRYAAYLEAAAGSQRQLSSVFGSEEIERLILGPTFHAFSGGWLVSSPGGVARLDHELALRIERIADAVDDLEQEIDTWAYPVPEATFGEKRLHALVLDTCVLEEHPSREALATLAPKWLADAGKQPSGIALAIAATSLDEIDAHKSANSPMHGTKKILKTEARKAQKLIAGLFTDPKQRAVIATAVHTIYGVLQIRPLNATRLPIADNDIISYALDLTSFAASVTFVSYDLGPCITARQQGLRALQLEYAPEDSQAASASQSSV